jgi:hypothetical protein
LKSDFEGFEFLGLASAEEGFLGLANADEDMFLAESARIFEGKCLA